MTKAEFSKLSKEDLLEYIDLDEKLIAYEQSKVKFNRIFEQEES